MNIVVQFSKLLLKNLRRMIQTLPRHQVKGPSYSHHGSNLCDLHVYPRSLRISMWKIFVHLVRSPLFDERSWAGGTLRSLVLVSCLLLTHLSKRLDSPLFPTDAATSPSSLSVDYIYVMAVGAPDSIVQQCRAQRPDLAMLLDQTSMRTVGVTYHANLNAA